MTATTTIITRNTFRTVLQSTTRSIPSQSITISTRSFAAAAAAASNDTALIKTSLYDYHKELGGDMVPFAGYELPVLYKGNDNGGVMKEHLWCRSIGKSSLFDVSHMGQIRWYGKDRVKFLESIVVSDIGGLKSNEGLLSLITNENGGIIDDTVITNANDQYIYMVVNGATKHNDMKHFQQQLDNNKQLDVTMEYLEDTMQLLAIQGPGAVNAISPLLPSTINLVQMPFMTGIDIAIDNIEGCRLTRCGYTGEDGFELSIPAQHTVTIAQKLLSNPTVNPTGLGARDSLRLEAGLCLYGNDLNETITPIEGALGWTIGQPGSRRRVQQGFTGANKILKDDGKFIPITKKRVGIIGMKAPARQHAEIYDSTGTTIIGEITSGTYSPCLKVPIAMGYVSTLSSQSTKDGTPIQIKIRDKMQSATITKMPFVPTRYYRVPE